jgi:Peptidase family C54
VTIQGEPYRDEALKGDIVYSRIDVDTQKPLPKAGLELSSSGRWYFEEDSRIMNHDMGDFPKAVLVILTVRLGLSDIDPEYFDSLKACFSLPQCVGILGGKPNFALYFVGCQDNHLIFLDPHFVQDAVHTTEQLGEQAHTYSSQHRSAKKIRLDSLDPCIGIGLLIRNGSDLRQVKEAFSNPASPLSKLATVYEQQPLPLDHSCGEGLPSKLDINISCDSYL